MLEFKIKLDTNENTITITGPTDLCIKRTIYSTDDMWCVFKSYIIQFIQKRHFGNYRIDKIYDDSKLKYKLSKDIKGTRSEWIEIGKFATYFDAYEQLEDNMYRDSLCPCGYSDCIWQDEETDLCKDCVAMNGYYYDDEDK